MTMPVWKDRRVERPNTYNIQTNIDGTITLIPVPGTVYEPGTPLNAHNLNQINTSLDEITLLINYKVMNITNINNGTIATLPSGCNDIVVVLTIADMYKIYAPIQILTPIFTSSFTFLVDQGGPHDEYIVNFTYDNGVLSFQKNVRFKITSAGTSTRETIEQAPIKTEFPRVTNILYK